MIYERVYAPGTPLDCAYVKNTELLTCPSRISAPQVPPRPGATDLGETLSRLGNAIGDFLAPLLSAGK